LPGAVALETGMGRCPGLSPLRHGMGLCPGLSPLRHGMGLCPGLSPGMWLCPGLSPLRHGTWASPGVVALKTRYMGFARGCRPKDTNEGLPPAKTRMMGCRPPDNDGRFTTGGGRYPLHPLTVTVYVGKACVGSGT
jgi:hypothetical protein